MKVIFQAQRSPDTDNRIYISREGSFQDIGASDLPMMNHTFLDKPRDTGVYFFSVNLREPGGRIGQRHHIYVEESTLKLDGRLVEKDEEKLDGVTISVFRLERR